jgi:hypothetical protein
VLLAAEKDCINFLLARFPNVSPRRGRRTQANYGSRVMEFIHQVLLCVAVYKIVINNFGNEGIAILIIP